MRKILVFIQNGIGGAERMTINIAKLLPSDEWDVMYCKVSFPCQIQSGRIEDFIPSGSKIINIYWSGQLSFLRQICKVLKRYSPDVVFSSVMPYNLRILFLSLLFRKIRFIVRNDNYLFTVNKLKRLSIKLTYSRAYKIIAQTEEMKSELEHLGLDSERVIVLHNLLDEKLISEKASAPSPFADDSKLRFVSVGRIAPQKGFDILVYAFREVLDKYPDAELYIVGDYDSSSSTYEYQKLKRLINKLELGEKVFFTGFTNNPYRYIKNASAYVLSSRYEGLPNVLVEAQFLGVPSAATKCIPMISRMITNGKNGFLADSENPSSLATAMLSAVEIKEVKKIYKPSSADDFRNIFI